MRKMRVFVGVIIGIGLIFMVAACRNSAPVEPIVEITQTMTPTFIPTKTPSVEPTSTPIFDDLQIKDFQHVDLCGQENEPVVKEFSKFSGLLLKARKNVPNSFKLVYVDSS